MASLLEMVAAAVLLLLMGGVWSPVTWDAGVVVAEATWCVARSDASDDALQTALDYACWSGADCTPIGSSGLCYLPNTIQAHASYAFNSYYQRKSNAPGSCDFAGTATVAKTDPSYGSCVYPSSPSTAGGTAGTPRTTTPSMNTPPPPETNTPLYGGGGLTPSGVGPEQPDASDSKVSPGLSTTTILISIAFMLFYHSCINPCWFCDLELLH
ncbi:hypothetical protein NMG60_11017387 [Bertholletia excelsa]